MNKNDVIDKIWNQVDLKKMDVELVVDALLQVIEDAMIHEESVNFSGIGKFEVKHRVSRKDPSKKVRGVHFETSRVLNKKINQNEL